MTTYLVRLPKPKAAKVIHGLTIDLFCRYITYHDQHDAVREFCQALRSV
jgi:hypothetical protein